MLKPISASYGCDPEGFFKGRDGRIIGSERILPEEGIGGKYDSRVVRDGIQFELNPYSARTVRELGNGVSVAFNHLIGAVRRTPGISVCWDGLVEVEAEELAALSERSQVLGCQPSYNIWGDRPITVDPKTYRKRSAGGHLHLGLDGTTIFHTKAGIDFRRRLIPLLDIFVGNLGVLFDRDPGAAERRENYGRAGEFRLPSYGVEYRVLSNFWLRNYTLMNMVFAGAKIAIATLEETLAGKDVEAELIDRVNIQDVIKAIDTNNFELAQTNYERLIPFLKEQLPPSGFEFAPLNVEKVLKLADAVYFGEKVKPGAGLKRFFPVDPLDHWMRDRFVDFGEYIWSI